MPIDVSCPHCGHAYSVKDESAGKRFKCKECGDVIDVPGTPLADGPSPLPADAGFESPLGETAENGQSTNPLPPLQRRRRGRGADSDSDDDSAPSPLGKVSLILGCIAWGLALVAFVVLMIMGFSMAQFMEENGGQPPDPEQAMTIGFIAIGSCGVGCLGYIISLVGTILGVIAVSQSTHSKGQAIGGLVLNGLYLLAGTGMFVLSIIAGQQ